VDGIVKVKKVTKNYYNGSNYVQALKEVDLNIAESEFVSITGPSGSGKTTLLSIMGGLEKPTSGTVELFGKQIDSMSDRELSKLRLQEIGFIFQEHNLLPSLTIRENIELPMELAKTSTSMREKTIKELLDIVKLEHLADRLPSEISRGQRQRIAALRALANFPKIILGDEPTSDLDRENARILLEFLKKINELYRTTIIITSTDDTLHKEYTKRSVYILDGEIDATHL
jgi:putative ABC transport system ATP-binding protein